MASRGPSNTAFVLVAIVAVAFNLRIGVTEVGPLIDRIRAETGMSATLAGALGSIPFACMGVFALVGMRLVLRTHARRLVAGCLLLLVVATVTRALVPTAGLVVLATVPIGIAIALMGLVLPVLVRTFFPQRTGAAMGAYVAALSVGASVAALTIVPLAHAFGGWRAAFAFSAIPTALCLALWLLAPSGELGEHNTGIGAPPHRPWSIRRPPKRAFLLAAVFGLQSMCFAAVTTWIAALFHGDGWSLAKAGFTTALVSILVIPGALVIPALSDRGDRRRWVLGTAVAMSIGMLGLAFAPTALPWVWIVLFGAGDGALFALTLTLPQELAGDGHARTELTAWTLGFGYLLSAMGPLIVGGLLDVTGAFVLPFALLGGMGVFSGVFAYTPALRPRPAAPAAARPAAASHEAARVSLLEAEQASRVAAPDR